MKFDKVWILGLVGVAALMAFKERDTRTPEDNRILYQPAFQSASVSSGVPAELLERVAQQESHFRSDIISGKVVSSAGALGIMQIIPRYHPTVNPLDPVEAIHYAADYLADLYSRYDDPSVGKYGTWSRALQAYNWGPGNLDKFIAGEITTMPQETIRYYQEILADVGLE